MTGRLVVAMTLAAAASAATQNFETEARRFATAYMAQNAAGVLEVRIDYTGSTANGGYVVAAAVRRLPDDKTGDQLSLLIDPQSHTVVAGLLTTLAQVTSPLAPDAVPRFVQSVLPQVLSELFGSRTRVRWPAVPAKASGVVPLIAEISTGYGWARWPMALSADARYVAVGGTWSLDRDPREVRRGILDSPHIQWDPGNEGATLKVIEFSDYQCPACKKAWGEVKPVFAQFGDKLRHGMVNFPLVRNHPWAFRAAVAGKCIASLWPDGMISFKEELYRLQDSLTLETVDDAVFGFLTQHSFDEKAFRACYLKDAAVDGVLAQLDLGQRLGVIGTPSYYVNGEQVAYGNKDELVKRLQAILAAGGIPENAR